MFAEFEEPFWNAKKILSALGVIAVLVWVKSTGKQVSLVFLAMRALLPLLFLWFPATLSQRCEKLYFFRLSLDPENGERMMVVGGWILLFLWAVHAAVLVFRPVI